MESPHPIFRWSFAIGCFGLALWFAKNAFYDVDPTRPDIDPVGLVWAGVLCVLALAVILTDLIAIMTKPLTMMVDSLFFPGGKAGKPDLNLKLPEYYLREGRHDEALDEYLKIVRHYPDEASAYEGAIDLLVNEFNDHGAAKKLYRKSKGRSLVLVERIDSYFEENRLDRSRGE